MSTDYLSGGTTLVKHLGWSKKNLLDDDALYTCELPQGRITVLNRMTGYGNGQRDIETGFRSNGWKDEEADKVKFWLASGMFDIREYPELTITEAIALIKRSANWVVGE